MITINHAGATDVGLRRKNNEDSYVIMPERALFAVADGMGGAEDGEIASSIFVETVREIFTNAGSCTWENIADILQETFLTANTRMLEYTRKNPASFGMGCTADIISFYDDRYIIGHIGDSRIYLFRDGVLKQITKDHSLVQFQIDAGTLSADDAQNHPKKNIILRALGIEHELSLDIMKGRAQHKDIFLLCTDGLSDMVEGKQISSIIAADQALPVMVAALISAAKAAGGKDNITVLLCRFLNE